MTDTQPQKNTERPPVVVIMGHIDHGKSTLLDYIRKSNIVAGEAGKITQHLGAYEIEHDSKKITFLDTPGHEAFKSVRSKGASVADIALLIVSAEDGVKTQTLEALKVIKENELNFIVVINKIDTPKANLESTKASLIENEIYIEGHGGNTPAVEISALTGQNVDELLDLILLSAEVEEYKGDPSVPAEGYIIETNKDKTKGISATLVIKNGTMMQGQFLASGGSLSPVRVMEDTSGKQIKEATFSTPVIIHGWNNLPATGLEFKTFNTKKEAEKYCLECIAEDEKNAVKEVRRIKGVDDFIIPIIIKGDAQGSIDAIVYELGKMDTKNAEIKVVHTGTGNITETDIKMASGDEHSIIVGFGVSVDKQAEMMSERVGTQLATFDIIYELTDWLDKKIDDNRPRVEVEKIKGSAKIMKIFNKVKNNQVVGGRVNEGSVAVGNQFKIMRRDEEIGKGIIKGLQQQKVESNEVLEGNEFGSSVDSKIELSPGDIIEVFEIVKE